MRSVNVSCTASSSTVIALLPVNLLFVVRAVSPTSRTLKKLRDDGYVAEVVEKWIPGANIRRDLFNFIDVVGIRGAETIGVQCTSRGHVNDRCKKIADAEHVGAVREAGWRIEVHGWSKNKSGRWQCKVVDCS